MTGNNKVWRAPVAGLASVAMLATLGVSAITANAASGVTSTTFQPAVASKTYTVTVNANGGKFSKPTNYKNTVQSSVAGDQEITFNDTKTVATITNVPATLDNTAVSALFDTSAVAYNAANTRRISGFYTGQSIGDGVNIANPAGVTLTGDTTAYAHWYAPSDAATITYPAGIYPTATNPTNTAEPVDVTVAPNDHLADWQLPAYVDTSNGSKMVSDHWSLNGAEVTADTPITTSGALTANPVNTVNITYGVVDSNAGINEAFQHQYVASGKAFTAYDSSKMFSKTPSGMEFVGWYEAKSSTVSTNNDLKSESFDFTKGSTLDVTLYAKFDTADAAVATATVNYYLDDTTNYLYGTDTVYNNWKTTVNEPPVPTDPTDKGRPFLYWADSYGVKYDFDSPVKADFDLHAVWGNPTVSDKTAVFDLNYTGAGVIEVDANADGTFDAPADPVREGYEFLGWSTKQIDSTLTSKFNPLKTNYADGEIFFAQWEKVAVEPKADLSKQIQSYPFKSTNTSNKATWTVDTDVADDFTEASWTAFRRAVNGMQKAFDSATDAEAADLYAKLLDAESKLVQTKNVTANVYRVYNPNNGDHVYAFNAEAQNLFMVGNEVEDPEFSAVRSESKSIPNVSVSVYRVYDPNSGEHLNVSQAEGAALVRQGWTWDNNGKAMFYVPLGASDVELYRVYLPTAKNAGRHVYAPADEAKILVNRGYLYDYNGNSVYTFMGAQA